MNVLTTQESYEDFLNAFRSTVISYSKVSDLNEDIVTTRNNMVLLLPTDLTISDRNLENVSRKFNHLELMKNENINQFDIKCFTDNNRSIFYCFYKMYHFDSAQYEDFFNALIKLREHLRPSTPGLVISN